MCNGTTLPFLLNIAKTARFIISHIIPPHEQVPVKVQTSADNLPANIQQEYVYFQAGLIF